MSPTSGRNIKQFVDQGYDVIITLGFLEGDETLKAALANPKIQFFGSDQFVCVAKDASDKACGGNPPNYQGLGFDEAQGGYLAGIVAGTITKSGTIGVVGGRSDIPGVQKFIKGYKTGAQSVRSNIRVLTDYTEDFGAPDKGEAVAKTMISQGADVMFHAAGGSGAGVLRAACNAKVWAIGGGQDEYVTVPDAKACIVTSAEQKFAASASSALARWKKSGMQSGNFVNSVSNDGMGLSQIRNLNPVPPELEKVIAKALDDLKSGRVDPSK